MGLGVCASSIVVFVPLLLGWLRSAIQPLPDAPPHSLFLHDVTTAHAKRKKSIDILKRRWLEEGLDSHTPTSRT